MEKKQNIVQYRERLEKTLSSFDLTNDQKLKELVQSQLLHSAQFDIQGGEEKVEIKTAEVSNILDMMRSVSVYDTGESSTSRADWKLKQDSDEFRVMYREGPEGTPFHTLMVEGYVDGPIDVGLCLTWESPLYKKWWPQFTIPSFKVTASDCLQKIQTGEQMSLVRMKPPWPLSTREAIVHYYLFEYFQDDLIIVLLKTVHDSKSVNATIDGVDNDAIPEAKDVVRIDVVGGYVLQKVTSERSYFRYLKEEWKERQENTCGEGEDVSSRFLNMRFLPVEVPQQENSYDCGLFLLHHLELFLAEAPCNFNPLKLSKFSNFLNLDWFQPAEAYLKRTLIQRLIFKLVVNNGLHEGFSSDDSGDRHCSENNNNWTGNHCPAVNGESSTSHSCEGIEMTVLLASSSPVLNELFEPGVSGHSQSFDQHSSGHYLSGSMIPMKEETDLLEHLMRLTTDPNFQQVSGISPPMQSCLSPFLSSVFGKNGDQVDSALEADHVRAESSRGVSSCAPDDSDDDIEITENIRYDNLQIVDNMEYETCEEQPTEKRRDNLQIIDNMESETCEEQPTKKRRLFDCDRDLMRGPSREKPKIWKVYTRRNKRGPNREKPKINREKPKIWKVYKRRNKSGGNAN